MKFLHVDLEDIQEHPNLADLIWPNGMPLPTTAEYFAVPATHPNISLIVVCLDRVIWNNLPLLDPTQSNQPAYRIAY